MMTPADVCQKLNISGSTLRKYAIEFEAKGILFQRNNKNARLFTVTEATAIHNAMKAAQSGLKSFENAVSEEVRGLKGNPSITPKAADNAVMESSPKRHDDSATVVMLDEIKSLKEEIRRRDTLFVEVLEKMEKKIDRLEQQQAERDKMLLNEISELKQEIQHQRQLDEPIPGPEKLEGAESPSQQQPEKKKGFFSRFFK